MRFHLLTVFWGDEFTDRFARIALRSLLAPGNLPALASAHQVVYHIYTSAADADRLSADPVFKEAGRYVEYRVHKVSLTETERRNPSTHWMLWHRGAAQLDSAEDVLITVAPDHLFGGDTLTRWAALFLDGQLAMFCPGVQVVLETLQEEIERSFPVPGPIDVGIDDLHGMMLRHLHPMKITMLRGSPRSIVHPEEHLRPIDGYGVVQNVLGSHAVAFRPRAIRVNRNFCPVEHLDRIAFEPCRYLSLEPALKALPLYLQSRRFDDASMSQFGEWGDIYLFDVNLRESRTAHVYALGRPMALPERRRAELASRFFVAQMHASRGVFKVWRALREAGRSRAALWLAAAHTHARLRRRLAPRLPVTIFVPEETVLGRLEDSERARLLSSGGRTLVVALKAHIADGRHTIARGDWLVRSDGGAIRMMDGSCYSVARRGEVRVTAGPIHVDDIDVYIVSRPLVPLALSFPRVSDARPVRWLLDGSARSLRRARSGAREQLRQFPRVHAAVVGLRDAWYDRFRRGAQQTNAVGGPSPALAASTEALVCRTADALRQLYGFYRDTVLAGTGFHVAPEQRFTRQEAPGERAIELLSSAVQSAPRFAEAWLELGFAHLDAGRPDAAIEAFERASTLPPFLPARPLDPDPRVVAALERARLLMNRNSLPEALAALEAVPLVGRIPRGFHQARARLLLQAGRIDEALEAFGSCMTGYAVYPSFGDLLPRDASALDARVLDVAEPWSKQRSTQGPRMLEPEIYRISERLAKAQMPTWRLAQTHAVDHFEKTGFPVRVSSLRELGPLLDTMQENRFDGYMQELGGLTDSEYALLIEACRDIVLFQLTYFSNRQPTLPLSTLLSAFTLYRKFRAVDENFRSVIEIGPGCGYLSFFLRHHAALKNYSQIEACESFYLLQSLVDVHCFPARFEERALMPADAPVQDYFSPAESRPAYTEISRAIRLNLKRPLCTHYPWWRIGELLKREKFQIATSNANLLEFSAPALDDYLTLLREILAPDGVFIVQCTGLAASGTLASLTDLLWQKGFTTLMFALAGKRIVAPGSSVGVMARLTGGPGSRVFPVNNCLFVGAGHPLFEKHRANRSTHVVTDEALIRDVFFAEPAGRRIYSAAEFITDSERSLQEICEP